MDQINQQRYMSMMISQLEGVKVNQFNMNDFQYQADLLAEEEDGSSSFAMHPGVSSRTTLKNDVKNLQKQWKNFME